MPGVNTPEQSRKLLKDLGKAVGTSDVAVMNGKGTACRMVKMALWRLWFVWFIWLIWFIWSVSFNQHKRDKPNKPNEQDRLASFSAFY
ncbi:MAG: hypothetical protein JW395_0864 [Nitrospira sp.]|nr:hypothetical protein [Nitrospira sp.]